MTSFTLQDLARIVAERAAAPETESYTAKLIGGGPAKAAKKLGEEAVEAVIEAMRGDKRKLAEESADLLYHLMVLWADAGIKPDDVYAILAAREGISGIAEKEQRKHTSGGN